jgi:hypothetical protein
MCATAAAAWKKSSLTQSGIAKDFLPTLWVQVKGFFSKGKWAVLPL